MVYVALLRGINVGGNNKVDMKQLKAAFEQAGLEAVTTYINSGNVIFEDKTHTAAELARKLEAVIEKKFGLAVKVLLRDIDQMKSVVAALPTAWKNDNAMKCDVMLLWEDVDKPNVIEQLTIKPGIDDVQYTPGAILWAVDRKHAAKSGIQKLVGTDLYRHMTIRNCNTLRKLAERMELASSGSLG